MKYLRVSRWDDYQPYRNRRAPWIKAYTDILDATIHPKFTNLTDGAKLTLHHLRLLAGVTGNRIPETWITSGHLNMQTKPEPRVTELEEAGFVEWFDGNASADASSGDSAGASAGHRARGRAGSRARSQSRKALSPVESLSGVETTGRHKSTSARDLVENFVVTDRHRAWAAENVPGVAVDTATDSWRDHFRANGYHTRAGPLSDADGAWRNWMRNELKFSRERNGKRNESGNGSARTGQRKPTAADFGMRTAADVLAAKAKR